MIDSSKPVRDGLVIMETAVKKPVKKSTRKKAAPVVKRPEGRPKKMSLDEIKNLEEPIYMPPLQKHRGRPKNENYIPFEEAREFIRGEMIPSRNKFHEWWERNKPKAIPRFPYRVYTTEWISWNDFLGTDNEFGVRVGKNWRQIDEAAMWVHTLKIESYGKWLEYCKDNTLPADIPARPDLVYASWKTWNHWLGNKPVEAMEAVREAQKIQIYYIIHEPGVPENVLNFGIDTIGPSSFKDRWQREHFTIVKLFWYDPAEALEVKKVVEYFSTPYLGDERQRIVPNVWEIVWYLQMRLDMINRL